jgi:geranylgeranyl pyrophosphate synthase
MREALYLAVIAVLVVVVVAAAAVGVRGRRAAAEAESWFGSAAAAAAAPRPGGGPLRPYRPAALAAPRTYDAYRREVDALVARAAALGEFGGDARLAAACAAALAGGKRVRAVIVLEVARAAAAGRPFVDAAEAALAVEYAHAASLAVDDLPAFDDDAVRRGRPSVHAAHGEATALLAALALLGAGAACVARQVDAVREAGAARNADRVGTQLCATFAAALGAAAAGQRRDGGPADAAAPFAVAELKTASFFEAAAAAGWVAAVGDAGGLADVRAAGRAVGLAFQVADDLGDEARDAARAASSGRPNHNIAGAAGRDVAMRAVERHLGAARHLLAGRGLWTPVWCEIFDQVRLMSKEPDMIANASTINVSVPEAQPEAQLDSSDVGQS